LFGAVDYNDLAKLEKSETDRKVCKENREGPHFLMDSAMGRDGIGCGLTHCIKIIYWVLF